MQTKESLEEQNSELHLEIDHLGDIALFLKDLKSENLRLKKCHHCHFECRTEHTFKEHKCNTQLQEIKDSDNIKKEKKIFIKVREGSKKNLNVIFFQIGLDPPLKM